MKKAKYIWAASLALLVFFASAMAVAFAMMSAGDSGDPETAFTLYDLAAGIAYALLLLAFCMVVAFPVFRIVSSYRSYLKTLLGLAGVAGVFFLCYLLSPDMTGGFYTDHGISPRVGRLINAGLITTYITLITTLIVFIFGEIIARTK